ncbi:MAG TPA: hypothetical protein VGO91_07930, partial [Pyrinomonadaceae bacterium]|nr:hypothetical protein [Pyrinomonadaceae bacterium]
MKRFFVSAVVVVLCVLAGASAGLAQGSSPRPFTIDELLKVRRVGDPQVSPDGRTVAYQIGV